MANICVIGLGRIGLPLALLLADAGHKVVGVDEDLGIINKIRRNNIEGAKKEKILLEKLLNKQFFVTNNLNEALKIAEIVFIAVGTGIKPDGTPDLSNLFKVIEEICTSLDNVKAKTFVIKSTLPIGTTRKIASFMEERTGKRCGVDFFLAFCPERVLGDKAIIEMASLPKIIGGMDRASSEKVASIYGTIGGKIIIVDRPETAELIKLADNAFRQTLFAFANDLALVAERYGINAYELIQAANDSYPRNNIPLPSAGVSGYCLTKDPLYLEAAFNEIALKRGFHSVWFWARKANDYMPVHVVELLARKLYSIGRSLKDSNILVCGITYKENVDDTRFSHGIEIANKLREEGANVYVWDPHVQNQNFSFQLQKINDPQEILGNLDALVFTVKHDEFVKLNDNDEILNMLHRMRTPIIFDGWGIFQRLANRKDILYIGVGIGE
ncbi:MAG: nucleotide sugar dehydrogenase [Nitrososphaerota archaeon]